MLNIVCPIINITVGLATMLAAGGSAIVAQKMGKGNDKEAKENFTLIICTGLVLGLLISVTGLIFLEPIIRGLGASDILFAYCRDYLSILLIFAPANVMQCLYINLFVTAGKPEIGLTLALIAGFTNIILDFVFIVPMQMGISGAAIATSIGYMIPTAAGTWFFISSKGSLSFVRPKLDFKVIVESCFNGSSEMVSQLSTAITTFLFNITMIRLLGEDGVAAVTIIIYSQFLLTTMYIGFSMGVAPVISYNYGSHDYFQLKRIFRICMGFVIACSVLVFSFSMLCGPSISQIFAERGTGVYEITKYGFSSERLVTLKERGLLLNTKERILKESMKLFSINGFEAVSIRAIASAVGVGNSALYKHYPSKQAIFDAIVEQSKQYFLQYCSYVQSSINNMEDFVNMCISMFEFQIGDEWIVMFRRILLIEQFKNKAMEIAFKEFFVELPLTSQKEIFEKLMLDGVMKKKNPEVLALELYAPFFVYHTVKCDKERLMDMLRVHAEYFCLENFEKKN
ncbi:MAG: MATE family efflux transporter [Lachnospiraceae bacterium]